MNHLTDLTLHMPNCSTGVLYEPVLGDLMVWDEKKQIELPMDRQDLLAMGWKLIWLALSLECEPDEDGDSSEGEYK